MGVIIEYEETFYKKLETGINIFAGAGFSVLPAPDGSKLPLASELAKDICAKFDLPMKLSNNLELVSMQAKKNDPEGFDKYLREVYRVEDSNPLYGIINKINIKSYITTNIDNLFQTIVEKDDENYVNSIANGRSKRIGRSIEYIPLHGDITDSESVLYFGTFEIAGASTDNRNYFDVMKGQLLRYPTLFWGYGFHDSSVMASIGDIMLKNSSNIWIQFRNGEEEKAESFKSLGFNVIIADTDELLSRLEKQLSVNTKALRKDDNLISRKIWADYKIPSQNQLKLHIDAKEYFVDGKMAWNVVYSKYPYETRYVREVQENYLKNKNIVIVGSPLCGKTTLMMQVALTIDEQCYFITEISMSHAKRLTKSLDEEITVFVDDCAADMEAFVILARHSKIHLVGAMDEFGYESAKHLLADVDYKIYMISDISKAEAKAIYGHISKYIKKDLFTYSKDHKEKYSFLEFGIDNINGIISKDRIRRFLKKIDALTREVLFLTAHLSRNNSFLSTDIIWSYFKTESYDEVQSIIDKANEALSQINEEIYPDLIDQDYFVLRSRQFLRGLIDVAIEDYRKEYGDVIKKTIFEVPRGLITRYYIYRRTAYDASLFYRLFGDSGDCLYDEIYSFDNSAYTLQQKALYYSRNHRFGEAFALIDKSSQELPNNFSIKNAKAIITFEANKYSKDPEARHQLDNAMEILAKCYKSDKRKVYHAVKFARYALYIYKEYEDSKYLSTAYEWMKYVMTDGAVTTKTRNVYNEIKEAMEKQD